ncbi:MAG: sterol desaturase family protein [Acidobacteriota bacterium]|nr:sterol desaturase family protein [Acidobacteriota bacterium]
MKLIAEAGAYLLHRLSSFGLNQKGVTDAITFAAVLAFCLILEAVKRRSLRRYRATSFRTDLFYSLVYLSGAYSLFVGLPVYKFLTRLLTEWVPFLQTRILVGVPAPVQFLVGLAAADLTYYLWHRSVHATPFLWAFHSIHHSQQELTIATSLRVHIFEEMVRGLFYFVPFFILAIPAHVWLPVDVAINWLLFLEHSDLDWTYGKVGSILVSPHFHRIHHSVELQDLNTNFGSFLSIWDRLFGTANLRAARPAAYGLAGDPVPESFVRQLAYPFVSLIRTRSSNPVVIDAPSIAPTTE